MWHGHMWGFGWGGIIIGGILMLLLWGGVITAVVLAIRALSGANRGAGASGFGAGMDTPMDILKTRYARGEIDRDEYLEKRRDLEA
jgi:putative membrane protein